MGWVWNTGRLDLLVVPWQERASSLIFIFTYEIG
jgi:hypothetical protein